jgi:hypothetical protein
VLRLATFHTFLRVKLGEMLAEDLFRRYPLIRSAPEFQVATLPSGSSMKIA